MDGDKQYNNQSDPATDNDKGLLNHHIAMKLADLPPVI